MILFKDVIYMIFFSHTISLDTFHHSMFSLPPWYQGLGAAEAGARRRQAVSRRAVKRVVILHKLDFSLKTCTPCNSL